MAAALVSGVTLAACSITAPAPSKGPSQPVRLGKTTEMNAVACPTADRCIAVGSYSSDGSSDRQQPLVEEWTAGGWAVLPAPSPSQNAALFGVACGSSAGCIAVGYEVADGQLAQRAFALVWSGQSFSTMVVPSPPGDTVLNGVACPQSRECVAVGYTTENLLPQALVERWNGHSWSVEPAARRTGSLASALAGVACPSPASCVAVGSSSTSGDHDDPESTTMAERWNGVAWSVEPTPTPGSGNLGALTAVACTAAASCVAVGNFSASNAAYQDDTEALIESNDTGAWTAMTVGGLVGNSQSALQSIACPARGRCAAVGSAPATPYGAADPLVETSASGVWSRSSSQPVGALLKSIACPTVATCLAVGSRDGGASVVAVWTHP